MLQKIQYATLVPLRKFHFARTGIQKNTPSPAFAAKIIPKRAR